MQENKTQMEFQEELLDFIATLKIENYFHLDVYRKKWLVPSYSTGIDEEDIPIYTDIDEEDIDIHSYTDIDEEDIDIPSYTDIDEEDIDIPSYTDIDEEDIDIPSYTDIDEEDIDIHSYTDIVDFELLEDEATIDNKSYGGILGAVIGALTESEKSHDLCTSMKIKITLNDFNNPVVFINFISDSGSVEKSSSRYRHLLGLAQKVMSILHLITASNDTIDNKENFMSKIEKKTEMELREEILDFRATLSVKKYFYLDVFRKKWLVTSGLTYIYEEDIHSYTDIVEFELLVDEATIVKSNGNAIVRAATGGLLFGPLGFFFGAITASEKSYDVCSIKIKITINDIYNPVVFIDSISYLEDAQEIMSILYLITDSNDTIDNKETSMSSVAAINDTIYNKETSMSSIADELKKFKELLDSGALNQTEFDELKSKLINNYK